MTQHKSQNYIDDNLSQNYKSQTLNPQQKHISLQLSNDNQTNLLLKAAQKAKKQIQTSISASTRLKNKNKFCEFQSSSTTRVPTAIGSKIRTLQKTIQSDNNNNYKMIAGRKFRPNYSISAMIRKRHSLQDSNKKINNLCNYLHQKMKSQNKRKQALKRKQDKLREIVSMSKIEHIGFAETIKNMNEEQMNSKFMSRNQVVSHKYNLEQILQRNRQMKEKLGEEVRNLSKNNEQIISKFHQTWRNTNIQSAQSCKSLQLKAKLIKTENQKLKLIKAEQNYKNKWMNQYNKNLQQERKHQIRMRKLNKKMQKLLTKTQQQF